MKDKVSKIVEHAVGEVVPMRGGAGTKVKLVPIEQDLPGDRPIGLYRGRIDIGPEFFEPLPEEELALWEG